MQQNNQKRGPVYLVNLVALLLVSIAAFAAARHTNSLAGLVSVVFLGLGTLVAAVSWFQMRMEQSEELERLELEEIARSHGKTALFEAKDSEIFPAQRAREQFERFFVPVFTVLICLAQGVAAYFLWRWLSGTTTPHPKLKEPTAGLFLFGFFALVLFLMGRFSSSFARLENRRLLRPGASYLMLNAILCAAVSAGIIGVEVGFPGTDLYMAYVLCGLLALVSVEVLVTLVLEIYRPRVKGRVVRPLYDSRLVGLLGQPEGLITTAAQAIDYQFGFKVSETWFYRFFEQAVLWVILLQFVLLLLSNCLVVIEPGEQALLETFGRPAEKVRHPGLHLKWPWPIGKVYRFKADRIQSFDIGFTHDEEKEKERAVLWAVSHTKEENFLIADRVPVSVTRTNEAGARQRTPPVSLLGVSIPVEYQIVDLTSWVYKNEDARSLLHDLATREVVRFMVGADLNHLLGPGRLAASTALRDRIQAVADRYSIGARIILVGMEDLHPPVKVAADYQKVVSAALTKQAKALAAQADAIRTNALANAQAAVLTNQAKADQIGRQIGALAQAGLFTNQIPAYMAAPQVYLERAYLQVFARATDKARKYLVLTTNTHDVLTFNLEESIAGDILRQVKVPAPSSTK